MFVVAIVATLLHVVDVANVTFVMARMSVSSAAMNVVGVRHYVRLVAMLWLRRYVALFCRRYNGAMR